MTLFLRMITSFGEPVKKSESSTNIRPSSSTLFRRQAGRPGGDAAPQGCPGAGEIRRPRQAFPTTPVLVLRQQLPCLTILSSRRVPGRRGTGPAAGCRVAAQPRGTAAAAVPAILTPPTNTSPGDRRWKHKWLAFCAWSPLPYRIDYVAEISECAKIGCNRLCSCLSPYV